MKKNANKPPRKIKAPAPAGKLQRMVRLSGNIALFAALLYVGIAWAVFQWRNPKSNEMSFYRHFWSVVKFEKIEAYQ